MVKDCKRVQTGRKRMELILSTDEDEQGGW